MSGLGCDPSLTPAYKGLTDADTVADWNPPEGFDFDKSLVTPADEEYWKLHKAAEDFSHLRGGPKTLGDRRGRRHHRPAPAPPLPTNSVSDSSPTSTRPR